MEKHRSAPRELVGGLSKKARKVKLRADVLLIDRELEAIKSSFGVELYDAIVEEGSLPDKFSPLAGAYEGCREIVDRKVNEQDGKHNQIDSHQSRRLRAPQPSNAKERARWIKETVTTRSLDAKLKLQTYWLDHEIKMAKQVFGALVFDLAMEMAECQQEAAIPQENSDCAIQRSINRAEQAAKGPKALRQEKMQRIEWLTTTKQAEDESGIASEESGITSTIEQ